MELDTERQKSEKQDGKSGNLIRHGTRDCSLSNTLERYEFKHCLYL